MGHPLLWTPHDVEAAEIIGPADGPAWPATAELRVMTWNVQYAAGRGYVFFYDTIPWGGPDERPSPFAVAHTLEGLAATIEREAPDVVLLQEIDVGAKRTDFVDQARFLRRRLPQLPWSTSAWYWRSAFVPHPRVRGAVGLQLLILSRFRLTAARRVALPVIPGSRLRQAFGFKRAILLAEVATHGGPALHVGSTHFDAFAQRTDTMRLQVARTCQALRDLGDAPWVLGGDFNLVASEAERQRLHRSQQGSYSPDCDLAPLLEWPSVPDRADLDGPERERWLTYHPNEPVTAGPDRAIDFVFHAHALRRVNAAVLRDEATTALSDHLPVVATLAAR